MRDTHPTDAPATSPEAFAHSRIHPLTRRAVLGAATASALVAGTGLQQAAADETAHRRRLLFNEPFGGRHLDRSVWNPWVTDVLSDGIPWFYRPELGQPNSALGGPNTTIDEYDLASNVKVYGGELHLLLTPGAPVEGYSHTGAVINSLPSTGDYGDGVTSTRGFTFADARVDIVARMPRSDAGGWGSIWFMNADPSLPGNWEFDLVETGMQNWDGTVPANTVTTAYHPDGGKAQVADLDLGEPVEAHFHTFSMEYKRGQFLRSYVDGRPVANFTTDVPTCPYFIMISNQVASELTDGWHTQKDPAVPLSTDLVVRSVKVWRL